MLCFNTFSRELSVTLSSYDDKVSSKGYNDGKNFNTSNKVRGTKDMAALA